MSIYSGKYAASAKFGPRATWPLVWASFAGVEVFAFFFLSWKVPFTPAQLWPLAFGAVWAGLLTAVLLLLPEKAGRILYGIVYFLMAVYAAVQTGYYLMFSQMMWLSDFRYASEGADYADVLLAYPVGWWLGIAAMFLLGAAILWKFPRNWPRPGKRRLWAGAGLVLAVTAWLLPEAVFLSDRSIRYAGSDYGRAQSAEAAYDNMFNAHRLYQVCGVYQTAARDVYAHCIYPLTPGHLLEQAENREQIDAYFAAKPAPEENEMTGILAGKNVILVLMESMDDWMIGAHTPTIAQMMEEGVNFTRFYTPVYGGIRTFNTEFCINNGSFLSSQGGYAFDYVTNHFEQSLASALTRQGYSAKTFHYNDPSFYSRGEFSPAMGYDAYVCYADYLTDLGEKERKNLLYDDLLVFDNQRLREEFFREGQPTLNFLITRSAHLSYKYNEVLSHWGLKKYPQYRGLTGHQETDCAYLKARLVDDLFARMLEELEAQGQLENTVIVGVTDHYTYGYKDENELLSLSGVEDKILLERTPCFLWSPALEPRRVDKVLNSADLLPTLLNLLGIKEEYRYMRSDAFDSRYDGFVPFSNGSWIHGDTAYDAGAKKLISISGQAHTVTAQEQETMARRVQEFVKINNLLLETDYYQRRD